MKKLVSLLLMSVLLFSLSACRGGKDRTKTCYIEITAAKAIECENLPAEKRELLPDDGVILARCEVKFAEGENAYDVVLRTLQENKIHYDADTVSKYFKGIGNLYSFDCGEFSGWSYYINGEPPMVGVGEYILAEGDELRFVYITDFSEG